MNRFLSTLSAIAFVATLGAAPAFAAGSSHMSSMSSTKCAKGQSYTKGYTKKDGTKVKGYCHASGKMKSSSMSSMKKTK